MTSDWDRARINHRVNNQAAAARSLGRLNVAGLNIPRSTPSPWITKVEMMNLRHFLTTVFTLVAVVPAAFLGYWVYDSALRTELAAVQERHLLLAKNITAALERYAQDAAAVFSDQVTTDRFAESAEVSRDLLEKFDFRAVAAYAPSGRVAARAAVGGAAAAGSLPAPETLRGLIAEVGSAPIFSPVLPDRSGRPTLYLTLRLADGRVAVGALDTRYIVRLQQAIAFGRKGHSAIVDANGTVIAHPREDWRRDMRNLAQVAPVQRMMAGDSGVSQFYSPAVRKDMISGFTTTPGTGWGVMVPQPLDELEARAESVLIVALLIASAGLATAAVIAWLLAGLVVEPVHGVLRAAAAIGRGRLDARVRPGGRLREESAPARTPSQARPARHVPRSDRCSS